MTSRQSLTIKETQDVSLEILKQVADVCEQNSFRYWLTYGTLIGVVRHKDYIPWDDDVDIMMPRPDYDKFLAYMSEHKEEFPYLEVFNPDTCSEYPYMITRVSDNRYEIDVNNEKSYGMGVFIDVYPMDGLGESLKAAKRNGGRGDRLSSLCYQATREHYAVSTTKSLIKKVLKALAFIIAKIIGKQYWQRKLQGLAAQMDYDKSKYVGCVVWLSGGMKDIFKREWFDELILLPFGKYEFYCPAEYDKVLRHAYGDYMQLPPEEERIGHHDYEVYRKVEC